MAWDLSRADTDEAAFLNYRKNNKIHSRNARGYPEWDGSAAQRQLKEDIESNLHNIIEPIDLWYLREVYDPFPLKVFRDHIYQEIKTAKYLHSLEVMGKSKMNKKK